MEQQIKESLIALMDGIKRADAAAISQGTRTLDALLEQARARLHPQLVHFLEQRSYQKAIMFLGGHAAIPAGSCGRRP